MFPKISSVGNITLRNRDMLQITLQILLLNVQAKLRDSVVFRQQTIVDEIHFGLNS